MGEGGLGRGLRVLGARVQDLKGSGYEVQCSGFSV